MRRFLLIREDNEAVAEGIIFSSGRSVICWVNPPISVAVYESFSDLITQQEKRGKHRVQWVDGPDKRVESPRPAPPSLDDAAALLGGIPPKITDDMAEDNAWKLSQHGVDPKTFEQSGSHSVYKG
jgi:hypothetical protein